MLFRILIHIKINLSSWSLLHIYIYKQREENADQNGKTTTTTMQTNKAIEFFAPTESGINEWTESDVGQHWAQAI